MAGRSNRGRCLRSDTSGSILTIFGLTSPIVAMAVAAAIEYSTVAARQTSLQMAVDAAALATASQLRLSNTTDAAIDTAARSIVSDRLGGANNVQVTTSVLNGRTSVEVSAHETMISIMGKLLGMSTSKIAAKATGQLGGQSKICVIALDERKSGAIMLDATAQMVGVDCVVHSNSVDPKGVASKASSLLKAPDICSSGGFEGGAANFSGRRTTDCPKQSDPLVARATPATGGCKSASKFVIESAQTIYPGVYCGGIEIKAGAQVTAQNGIYIVKDGQLKVDDNSKLYGRNVSFYFTGAGANFDFLSSSVVDLSAPKDGALAGILFFGDRNASDTREYKITSDFARTLIGTIYIPRGILTIDAKNTVADQSAYTAIVAHRIELKQSPNLVLNSKYESTDVPVPMGLGPNVPVKLVR